MSKITAAILDALGKGNLKFCDFGQAVRADNVLMAKLGHPATPVFTELRTFFDSLAYASNNAARYFTYKSALEHAEFTAPRLALSWYPRGVLASFGHVYPTKPDWDDYIEAAAVAGWPTDAAPRLNGGSWLVRTQNVAMCAKFMALKNKAREEAVFTIKAEFDDGADQAYFVIDTCISDVDQAPVVHAAISEIVREFHGDYVLPARLPEQEALETAPLPMYAKKLSHANVKDVTVGDRLVLVPLVARPADPVVLSTHIEKLCGLLALGFPFAEASTWLKNVLRPDAFKSLQQQYG